MHEKLRICSYLLKKSSTENFILFAIKVTAFPCDKVRNLQCLINVKQRIKSSTWNSSTFPIPNFWFKNLQSFLYRNSRYKKCAPESTWFEILQHYFWRNSNDYHCVKSVLIRSFFDPYFPVFGLNTERYGVFSPNAGICGL